MGEAADIGRRVQRLRIGSGAALGDIADALGVSSEELSAIESGAREIGDTELTVFAEFVGVSELAILEPDSLLGRLAVAPRAGDETLSTREAHRRLTALAEIHHVLRGGGHDARPRVVNVPDDGTVGWLSQANRLAEWAGQRLGNLTSDPPEADRFAALAAAIESQFGVDVMVESLGKDGPLGMAMTDPEFPFILINADMIRPRSTFTLAHELGHVLAGDGSEIKIDEDLRGDNDEERLANAFAAALLMPEQRVNSLIEEHGRDAKCLAMMILYFGVSFESLIYRLHNLQVINAAGRDALRNAGLHGLLRKLENTEESAMLLAARERLPRKPPLHLTTRCIGGIWDGTISAAPLAGLLGVETDDLVEKLRNAWETADAITEDYSTPKDSPDVVERAYDADPVAV
ncbi:MAG: ImmA/IrrE family metallo-endopeptidase [Acidimicrobiales bacterium]|nr:ImmA/IrrE family metallo-endopeptidase [Acidimicrobiales bacterium]MYD82178.1 ImmA/IrrE family metallo-endopeptidase [Acidimicrobiales bacterium]MYJ64217.1 ImmA/IrrE family metallo-endopeptidase [Acidimicrobiales bacterium]